MIGLSKILSFILILADRMIPSVDLLTSWTTAIFQCPFSVPSSITKTTSPTCNGGKSLYHLVLGEISGKISFIKCFQISFSIFRISWNFAPNLVCFISFSGVMKSVLWFPMINEFGVRLNSFLQARILITVLSWWERLLLILQFWIDLLINLGHQLESQLLAS